MKKRIKHILAIEWILIIYSPLSLTLDFLASFCIASILRGVIRKHQRPLFAQRFCLNKLQFVFESLPCVISI